MSDYEREFEKTVGFSVNENDIEQIQKVANLWEELRGSIKHKIITQLPDSMTDSIEGIPYEINKISYSPDTVFRHFLRKGSLGDVVVNKSFNNMNVESYYHQSGGHLTYYPNLEGIMIQEVSANSYTPSKENYVDFKLYEGTPVFTTPNARNLMIPNPRDIHKTLDSFKEIYEDIMIRHLSFEDELKQYVHRLAGIKNEIDNFRQQIEQIAFPVKVPVNIVAYRNNDIVYKE